VMNNGHEKKKSKNLFILSLFSRGKLWLIPTRSSIQCFITKTLQTCKAIFSNKFDWIQAKCKMSYGIIDLIEAKNRQ
jgi:hypothetical protein